MCRLFAYIHAGSKRSPWETLGAETWSQFRELSLVHADGWGTAWLSEGHWSRYLSSRSLRSDPSLWQSFLTSPVGAAVIHERWASPGIARAPENQQPFFQGPWAFAHNGTIGTGEKNIVHRPTTYRSSLGIPGSTTMSDSKIYAEILFRQLGETTTSATVAAVHKALEHTIGVLRKDYPDASFNSILAGPDFTVLTRAHASSPVFSEKLCRCYEEAGWTDRIADYYELGFTKIVHADGSTTIAAASSGFRVRDTWTTLENNSCLILDHQTASVTILPLST